MSSRIFTQVRTLKGLACGAGGFMVAPMTTWARSTSTATKPGSTAEATSTILREIEKIRQAPVTDEELKRPEELPEPVRLQIRLHRRSPPAWGPAGSPAFIRRTSAPSSGTPLRRSPRTTS